jgi:uncharacterized lipoprotein YehR (DUF1307 family)
MDRVRLNRILPHWRWLLMLPAIGLLAGLLAACSHSENTYKTTGHVFGTAVAVTIYGGSSSVPIC